MLTSASVHFFTAACTTIVGEGVGVVVPLMVAVPFDVGEEDGSRGVKQGDICGPVLYKLYIFAIMTTWRIQQTGEQCLFRTAEDDIIKGRDWHYGSVPVKNSAGKIISYVSQRRDGFAPSDQPDFYAEKGYLVTGVEEFAVSDVLFADDTALIFNCRAELDRQTPLLFKHIARWGMLAHSKSPTDTDESKTVVVFVATYPSTYADYSTFDDTNFDRVQIGDGHTVPIVEKAKYLGSVIARCGTDRPDIENRLSKAAQSFGALKNPIFRVGSIDVATKVRVYLVTVLSVLLFGSESWTITADLWRKLKSFHRRCARFIFGITMWHVQEFSISTESLLSQLSLRPIGVYVARRNLAWFGCVYRMPWSRLPRKLMTCWCANQRTTGNVATWSKTALKCMEIVGIDTNNWPMIAGGQVAWCEAVGIPTNKDENAGALNTESDGCGPISIPDDRRILSPTAIVAYTDGSCIGNSHVRSNEHNAGWGAVMLTNASGHISDPNDGSASILSRLWGPVITDSDHPSFLGATHGSNNTGELTAIGEVFRWAQSNQSVEPLLIRYDSTYAAMIAQNLWTVSSNIKLARSVQSLYTNVSLIRPIFFSRHTLSDILLYDAISAKRVLLALESQVLLQDLRNMEGASEKMISGQPHAAFQYHLGDTRIYLV